ncbi:MAG: carbohydrate-binding protein [Pseudomonadota bacterium]
MSMIKRLQTTLALLLMLLFTAPSHAVMIDWLVLYDDDAVDAANNDVRTMLEGWISDMNSIYAKSGVDIQVRLVGAIYFNPKDSSGKEILDSATLLPIFRDNGQVKEYRDLTGADFVTGLQALDGSCGRGYVSTSSSYAINVADPDCGVLTVTHELGHNMGLNHSRKQGHSGGSKYRYGLGYGEDNRFATIMAYGSAFSTSRVAELSNPNRFACGGSRACGIAVGDSEEAYAALAIHNERNNFANFRAETTTRLFGNPILVDLSKAEFTYDFGPVNSPVLSGHTLISPDASGNVRWSQKPEGRDRGSDSSRSAAEQDFLIGFEESTFSHDLDNGIWRVTLQMGDGHYTHNDMRVSAENGQVLRSNIDSPNDVYTTVEFDVEITDGVLDLTFSFEGNRDWVLNRMELRKIADKPVVLDTRATQFDFDFGTLTSPVRDGWIRISEKTTGDVNWDVAPRSSDHGTINGINEINQDFVFNNQAHTLSQKIGNGVWAVTLNMGDAKYSNGYMQVMAEGEFAGSIASQPAGQFPYVNFEVTVTDGILDLTFSGGEEGTGYWVLNRMSLNKVEDLTFKVDLTATKYDYDFGSVDSPVQSGWTPITPETQGDIYWSQAPQSLDRGVINGVNDINRDLVFNSVETTFSHVIADGLWRVVLNMGDAQFMHDESQVSAEGVLMATGIGNQLGEFPYVIFETPVTDGELNITFADAGGQDSNWVLTRMTLERLGDVIPQQPVGKIEAENFVLQSGVQIGNTTDTEDTGFIGWIENGDWSEYLIDVPTTGEYKLDVRVATDTNGGYIDFVIDGTVLTSVYVDPQLSDGWQDWVTVSDLIVLSQGSQRLRLNFRSSEGGGIFNINWFEIH